MEHLGRFRPSPLVKINVTKTNAVRFEGETGGEIVQCGDETTIPIFRNIYGHYNRDTYSKDLRKTKIECLDS